MIISLVDDALIDVLRFFTRQLLARLEFTSRRVFTIVSACFSETPYHQMNKVMCSISMNFTLCLQKRDEGNSTYGEVGESLVYFILFKS